MNRALAKTVLVLAGIFFTSLFVLGIGYSKAHAAGAKHKSNGPQRVVSMAPSITEILFALGLGDRVVGVTKHCIYPPEALTKAKVGGYLDPSYETIIALKPDLVIAFSPDNSLIRKLGKLGLKTFHVDHESIPGILYSIRVIGATFGVEEKANGIIDGIESKLKSIKRKTLGKPKPRVLVSVSRSAGSGQVRSVYVAGRKSFYNDIIRFAGGVNALDGNGVIAYPKISGEGLISLKPDHVIDIIPTLDRDGVDETTAALEWKNVAPKGAIKEGRVHVFGQNHMVIPGPRFIETVERFARAIHPEIEWN